MDLISDFSSVIARVLVYGTSPLYDDVYVLSNFFWYLSFNDSTGGAPAIYGSLSVFGFNSHVRAMMSIFILGVLGSVSQSAFFMFCQVSVAYGGGAGYYVILGFRVSLVGFTICANFRCFGSVVLRAQGGGLYLQVPGSYVVFRGLQTVYDGRRSRRGSSLGQASLYYRNVCYFLVGVFLARFVCFQDVRQA